MRISERFTWARGVLATVTPGANATRSPFGSYFRDLRGAKLPIRCYWLELDEPQMDAEGDGPYVAAEIAEDYLEPA